jgi:hypothetical protein
VEKEFASFGEFSQASTERNQVFSSNNSSRTHQMFISVVDAIAVKSKTVCSVIILQQKLDFLANVLGQLLEQLFCFVVG